MTKSNTNIILGSIALALVMFFTVGCAPYATSYQGHISVWGKHEYTINFVDVDEKPLDGVLLKYEFHDQYSQDKTNIPHDELIAKPTITREYVVNSDPGYVIKMFQSKFKYEVSKDGYYSQKNYIAINSSQRNSTITKTIKLLKPNDFFQSQMVISNKKLKESLLKLIQWINIEAYLTNVILDTKSIGLTKFKDKNYLSLSFSSTQTYNNLKLNRYDIGKEVFDSVIRKILNPLVTISEYDKDMYGYDITVNAYSKSFAEKYELSKEQKYRFLIPSKIVKKYKNKDISGQQLIDNSFILLNDERIDLKLQ